MPLCFSKVAGRITFFNLHVNTLLSKHLYVHIDFARAPNVSATPPLSLLYIERTDSDCAFVYYLRKKILMREKQARDERET